MCEMRKKRTSRSVLVPLRLARCNQSLQKKTVRVAMNVCIGIKQDKDICELQDLPTEDAVEDYDNDPENAPIQPTLDPMRPALVRIRSEWNEQLWQLLEADMLEDTGFDSAEMKNAFLSRLTRLARVVRESRRRVNETQEQFEGRRTGHAENQRMRQRAHTRRATVRHASNARSILIHFCLCSYSIPVKQLPSGTGWTMMASRTKSGVFLTTLLPPSHRRA